MLVKRTPYFCPKLFFLKKLKNTVEEQLGFVPQFTEPVFIINYAKGKRLWNVQRNLREVSINPSYHAACLSAAKRYRQIHRPFSKKDPLLVEAAAWCFHQRLNLQELTDYYRWAYNSFECMLLITEGEDSK
jgi:hypothetical protein